MSSIIKMANKIQIRSFTVRLRKVKTILDSGDRILKEFMFLLSYIGQRAKYMFSFVTNVTESLVLAQ